MFIAALFTIARTWKQPWCPFADEWIRKLWYIYTMEYYSTIKKNSFESVLMRWMKLEPIIQSEVCQKDKEHYGIQTEIYGIWKDSNDYPKCKTEKETQIYRRNFWTFGLCGRSRGWDVSREQHWNMYIIYSETDHQPRLDTWDKCSGLVHCQDQEESGGEGVGMGDRDGEYM